MPFFYKSHFNPNDKEAVNDFNKSLENFESHLKNKKTDFFSGKNFCNISNNWPELVNVFISSSFIE